MDPQQLEATVQRMLDAGEDDAVVAAFVRHATSPAGVATSPAATEPPPVAADAPSAPRTSPLPPGVIGAVGASAAKYGPWAAREGMRKGGELAQKVDLTRVAKITGRLAGGAAAGTIGTAVGGAGGGVAGLSAPYGWEYGGKVGQRIGKAMTGVLHGTGKVAQGLANYTALPKGARGIAMGLGRRAFGVGIRAIPYVGRGLTVLDLAMMGNDLKNKYSSPEDIEQARVMAPFTLNRQAPSVQPASADMPSPQSPLDPDVEAALLELMRQRGGR